MMDMALTPRSRFKYQRALAQQMGQDAASTAPVQHWTQGLARMLQGGLSGYLMNKGMQGEQELDQARRDTLARALGAGSPDAAIGILAQNPETADMGAQLGFQKMFAEPQGPITLGAGETLFDPTTYQPLAQGAPKPENTPSAIQEYEFAKSQGFTGSFQDWKALNRPAGTTIRNESPPPPGYRVVRDANGLPIQYEPIPGSPAAAEAAALEDKATTRQGMKETQAGIVTDDINNALTAIESAPNTVAGLFGSALAVVPGTPAYDLQQTLMTIGANIGFDKLQAMREASPTGGALGSVSDFENRQLQATYGALAQSQSPEQLARNLRRLHNVYNDIVHGPGNGPPRYNLETGQIAAPQGAPAPGPAITPPPAATAPGALPPPPPGFQVVR